MSKGTRDISQAGRACHRHPEVGNRLGGEIGAEAIETLHRAPSDSNHERCDLELPLPRTFGERRSVSSSSVMEPSVALAVVEPVAAAERRQACARFTLRVGPFELGGLAHHERLLMVSLGNISSSLLFVVPLHLDKVDDPGVFFESKIFGDTFRAPRRSSSLAREPQGSRARGGTQNLESAGVTIATLIPCSVRWSRCRI